jgi:methylmalonyl-CoA mutase
MNDKSELFSEFKAVSKKEWLEQIVKDLKGKSLSDFQQKIGKITLEPFPHPEDLHQLPMPVAGDGNDWEIAEDIDAKDITEANKSARMAVQGGTQSVRFHLSENLGDHRIDALLDEIDLTAVSIHFLEENKNANPLKLLQHFHHCAAQQHLDTTRLRGSVNWTNPEALISDDTSFLLEFASQKLPAFKIFNVNGASFHKGETNTVEELTEILKAAESILAAVVEQGFAPGQVNYFMQFMVAVGKNYFIEIAKLRALKLLWANVLKAYEVDKLLIPPIDVYCAPVLRNGNTHDNMIMATTQAMSAIIGGAGRLTILPSDVEATAFARQVARNVQHILKFESHFDQVADPVAGSYFIEMLTNDIASAAWEEFKTNK